MGFFLKIETEADGDESDNSDSECNDTLDLSRIREMRFIPSDPSQCKFNPSLQSLLVFIGVYDFRIAIYILVALWVLQFGQELIVYEFIIWQWIHFLKYSASVLSLIQNLMMVSGIFS